MEPQELEEFEQEAPAPVADPLSFIRPRQKRPLNITKYTRRITWLRWGLPVGALLILMALVVWPMLDKSKIKAIAVGAIPDLVIKNLRLTGLDSKNEPYSLLAVKTTRPGGLKNIYDLDKPEGEITLANGTWVAGKAQYGRYDQDTHKLWLGGDVQLFQDKGNQFTTDEAQVDLTDNHAWGEKPVLIQGAFGEIRGQGFRMLDSGKVMVVTGPARAMLDLHGGNSSDKPAATAP
jgi:lipopolysaccharide export system protein LptC